MAGEVRLVEGDVFDGNDAGFPLHLEIPVDEKKGIAVRQDGHDFDDVHGLCGGVWLVAHAGLSINVTCDGSPR